MKKAESEPARPPARNLKTACWRDNDVMAVVEAEAEASGGEPGRRRCEMAGTEIGVAVARTGVGGGGRRAQAERRVDTRIVGDELIEEGR